MSAWLAAAAFIISAAHGGSSRDSGPHDNELLLDLTTPYVQQVEARLTWGCGGGSLLGTSEGIVLPPPLPLGLRVDSLTGEPYRLGEDITSQLVLRNTRREPFKIPWSVDAGLIFSKDCKWLPGPGVVGLHGSITLVFEDESGKKDFIASHGLFGISSDPSTFRELAPGESMEIKTAGKLELYNIAMGRKSAGLSPSLPIPVTVTASFTLDDGPAFGRYRPVVSANSLRLIVLGE